MFRARTPYSSSVPLVIDQVNERFDPARGLLARSDAAIDPGALAALQLHLAPLVGGGFVSVEDAELSGCHVNPKPLHVLEGVGNDVRVAGLAERDLGTTVAVKAIRHSFRNAPQKILQAVAATKGTVDKKDAFALTFFRALGCSGHLEVRFDHRAEGDVMHDQILR
jgi:hypothetical protein